MVSLRTNRSLLAGRRLRTEICVQRYAICVRPDRSPLRAEELHAREIGTVRGWAAERPLPRIGDFPQ